MVICIYHKGGIRKTVVIFAKIILVKNNILRYVVPKGEPRLQLETVLTNGKYP